MLSPAAVAAAAAAALDPRVGGEAICIETLIGGTGAAARACLSADETIPLVRRWDGRPGRQVASTDGRTDGGRSVARSPRLSSIARSRIGTGGWQQCGSVPCEFEGGAIGNSSPGKITMLLHGAHSPLLAMDRRPRPKRKAESQDNERLSKRLGLLNLGMSGPPPRANLLFFSFAVSSPPQLLPRLSPSSADGQPPTTEKNGHRLYVPVESPAADGSGSGPRPRPTFDRRRDGRQDGDDAGAAGAGRRLDAAGRHEIQGLHLQPRRRALVVRERARGRQLLLLPDIHKHLRANRIPPVVLPNSDGELAGMQLVLYNKAPSSLTVPAEQDSVRKAIIDARARFREKQREEREAMDVAADAGPRLDDTSPRLPGPPTKMTTRMRWI